MQNPGKPGFFNGGLRSPRKPVQSDEIPKIQEVRYEWEER